MPNEPEISTRVREFISSHFHLARKQSVTDATPLLETGIVDSLGVLDLVRFVESDSCVHIADEDLTPENFATITSISDMVKRKLRNG